MTELLFLLLSIALLDSTSMIPLTVVPMALMLNGTKPFLSTGAFLLGIFVTYFAGGVAAMFGLDALSALIGPWLETFLYAPTDFELGVQLVIGLVMVAFGWKLASARESHGGRGADQGLSPGACFTLGASLTLVGLPGALPYFGAVDAILRMNAPLMTNLAALVFYNTVFVLPHAALVLIRLLAPRHSERIFKAVSNFAERWGRRLIITVLLVVGAVLAADAIGWWMGNPLLPVFEPEP